MAADRKPNPRYGERPAVTGRACFAPRVPEADWRRVEPPSDDHGFDRTEAFEAVFTNEDLYRLAEALPVRAKVKPGAPAHYPQWALVAYAVLIAECNSSRKVHTAFSVASNWRQILDWAEATAGPLSR